MTTTTNANQPAADRPAHLPVSGMLIQTRAMFVDAYRELNSKKLFWITMILSGVVVGAFAAVGFDASGFSIFWKSFPHAFFNTTIIPKDQLYQSLFISLGVHWWLGFFALILALISTAPLFPDFLSGGAVDLFLSRPLGRTRLFLTKYVVGLLFVGIQVAVFCLASFLVIGIRGGAWVPGIFLAVPIVVLLFSYLWSVCALLGTITRSTIAALLLTLLAWFAIFGVHAAESVLLTFSVGTRVEREERERDIARYEAQIARLRERPAATRPKSAEASQIEGWQRSLDAAVAQRGEARDPFARWHALAYAAKWPLPKLEETTKLLERSLEQQFRPRRERRTEEEPPGEVDRSFFENPRVQRLTGDEVEKVIRGRSATWVIGTSLLFEAAMLGIATWFFSRRDY